MVKLLFYYCFKSMSNEIWTSTGDERKKVSNFMVRLTLNYSKTKNQEENEVERLWLSQSFLNELRIWLYIVFYFTWIDTISIFF